MRSLVLLLAVLAMAAAPLAAQTAPEKPAARPGRSSAKALAIAPVNLNTATDEQILLIPGVGNRMLREFKEYRPYTALAQFHREIGKYVDNTELARLEQYVFVPVAK